MSVTFGPDETFLHAQAGHVWQVRLKTLQTVVVDVGLANGGAAPIAAEFDPNVLVLTHSDDDRVGEVDAFFQLPPEPQLSEV
ncbi:hypothetical protein [Jiangella alkaliphila]|uniref:hypothetical protein n=1 Tax=Jiangella alkaliphila TaxID=419479 RepID=UPI00128E7035|nr:hypothetical protein [Jiangella alkaliphila]